MLTIAISKTRTKEERKKHISVGSNILFIRVNLEKETKRKWTA